METLDGTEWDVLIAGTGIQQSLLALALSRSNKKILHVDKNDFYGGPEAALSLQDAQSWVKAVNRVDSAQAVFQNASIFEPQVEDDAEGGKLSFSRAYSLALAPELIYTKSELLASLVSSKTYRQIEFVAMGSWFVYVPENQESDAEGTTLSGGALLKIPTTREDLVFSDKSIDIRSKRIVMKVLRFLMEYEDRQETWQPYADRPFSDLLSEHFKLPTRLHGLFLALTLSLENPQRTMTSFSLPRIARHLRSTGRLGSGFSSVIPKWGGLSEIAQVACRAGAVGGAVYVLGKGIQIWSRTVEGENSDSCFAATLDEANKVKATWIAGQETELPHLPGDSNPSSSRSVRRSISIISSTLDHLFPNLAEGSPPPAGAVVVFPAESLSDASPPVYIIIHSSDTGECPTGQSIIYAATSGPAALLEQAVNRLLVVVHETPQPVILWCLRYQQQGPGQVSQEQDRDDSGNRTIVFPRPSLDLAFDEGVLDAVANAWTKIMGAEAGDFLVFQDRNGVGDEDEE